MIHFAATVLRKPLDPWQQWLVIHAGEMLDDGRPRFRTVLVIVARQNGKTHLCMVLSLFWLYVERWPLVFGTSNKLDYAKDSWEWAMNTAMATPALKALTRKPRIGNGQQDLPTVHGCHYRIGAANEDGGRSKSIDRAIGDELRQQKDWSAYAALKPTMNARPRGQVVYITNMGDAQSVVLNSLRGQAMDAIAEIEAWDGDGNEIPARLLRPVGLFEWSAAPGSHPMDRAAWAAANPQLGRRMDPDVILEDAAAVAKPGADLERLQTFLTEILCLQVDQMDPAFSPDGWAAGRVPAAIDLSARGRLAACVDVSPDMQHVTLAVALLAEDGRTRVEVVRDWSGSEAVVAALTELPEWIARIRPRQVGFFPGGPAATFDGALRDRNRAGARRAWPPRGVTVAEIKEETAAAIMAFAAYVGSGMILHSGQALLDAQIGAAERLHTGDRWVITRRGAGHVDAVYAAAGAAHVARTMPAARGGTRRVHSAG